MKANQKRNRLTMNIRIIITLYLCIKVRIVLILSKRA